MSCKVLPAGTVAAALPPRWKDLRAPEPECEPADANFEPADSGEVNKLHTRIAELERTMELQVRQTRERAFQEGQKAGRESAAAEVQPVLNRMLQSCTDLAGMRPRIRRETESDIVVLTVAIARRVLRREISVDPDAIHGIVKAALEKVQTKEICLVRTHPDHVAAVRGFFEKSGLAAGLQITADTTLEPGGLVLETKRGNLDASVETQLKEIERGFTDRLGK